MLRRGVVAAIAVVPMALLVTAAPARAGIPTCAQIHSDFNGDGHADIAAGAPDAMIDGQLGAGTFRVVYGGASGVATTGTDQYFDQDTPGIPGAPTHGGVFGGMLATGFFNGDCYADLAVPVFHDGGGESIMVLYGSSAGLSTSGMSVMPASSVYIGNSLAVGDFNGDGYDDLAAGAIDTVDQGVISGAVAVMGGSAAGLQPIAQWITLSTPSVPGSPQSGAGFGAALAAADFNGDGLDDLAVDASDYNNRAGMVDIIFGSSGGLTGSGARSISRTTSGMPATGGDYEAFGEVLAAGYGHSDRYADLAIGTIADSVNGLWAAGTVIYLPGSSTGPNIGGAVLLSQDTAGIPGSAEEFDEFGWSLVMGDFDGDGHSDLAIGDPRETVGQGPEAAGTVTIVPVTAGGPAPGSATLWYLTTGGVCGAPIGDDAFGNALYAANIKTTLHKDLVVGIPYRPAGAYGTVAVLYGSPTGVGATGSQCFAEPADHVPGGYGDQWGSSVA